MARYRTKMLALLTSMGQFPQKCDLVAIYHIRACKEVEETISAAAVTYNLYSDASGHYRGRHFLQSVFTITLRAPRISCRDTTLSASLLLNYIEKSPLLPFTIFFFDWLQ